MAPGWSINHENTAYLIDDEAELIGLLSDVVELTGLNAG